MTAARFGVRKPKMFSFKIFRHSSSGGSSGNFNGLTDLNEEPPAVPTLFLADSGGGEGGGGCEWGQPFPEQINTDSQGLASYTLSTNPSCLSRHVRGQHNRRVTVNHHHQERNSQSTITIVTMRLNLMRARFKPLFVC